MSTVGLSIQCAQIFWTPVQNLLEYQCAFCQEYFSVHNECLDHLKICLQNGPNVFDNYMDTNDTKTSVEVGSTTQLEIEMDINPPEDVESQIEFVSVYSDESTAEDEYESTTAVEFIDEPPPQSKPHRRRQYNMKSRSKAKELTVEEEANNFSNLLCRNKDVECDFCGLKRKSRFRLMEHMITVHKIQAPETRYECNLCPKSFDLPIKLDRHIKRHTAKFSCEYCGKIFTDTGNLKVHTRIHTGERPYECSVCNKTFASNNSYSLHMKIHSGEKPFKCPDCPMAFIMMEHLKKHSNVHTKVKSYKCDDCDKEFSHSNTLRFHKRTHTGERPHKCSVCARAFGRPSALKVHMNIHTGNSPYMCRLCERGFHSSAARRSHEKTLHKASVIHEVDAVSMGLL